VLAARSPALRRRHHSLGCRRELISIACGLERLGPPDQLIQHVFDAGLQVGEVLEVLAVLPHRHEIRALNVDAGADGRQLQLGGNET
jgi:hypothetical protein